MKNKWAPVACIGSLQMFLCHRFIHPLAYGVFNLFTSTNTRGKFFLLRSCRSCKRKWLFLTRIKCYSTYIIVFFFSGSFFSLEAMMWLTWASPAFPPGRALPRPLS